MQLNLRDTRSKGQTSLSSERIDITDIVNSEPSIHACGPLEASAKVKVEANNVIVQGHVEGKLELICSRCLTVFDRPLSVSFEEQFTNEKPDEEWNEQTEEDEIHYVEEDRIELVPYFMEHIILAIPQFPLCGDDCKGLCPTCGHNRNTEPCSCYNEKVDPRWSGLKDLFQSE